MHGPSQISELAALHASDVSLSDSALFRVFGTGWSSNLGQIVSEITWTELEPVQQLVLD